MFEPEDQLPAWIWPLRGQAALFPDAVGQFGHQRKHDVHTGVDLYCELGTEIVACEDGKVISVSWFTGAHAPTQDGSPASWWNDTKAIMVEGASGVIVYGEIGPDSIAVVEGQRVSAGQLLATVDTAVLKSFKGRPNVMLHLELMRHGAVEALWWTSEQQPPSALRDPTEHLRRAAPEADQFDISRYDGEAFVDRRMPRKASPWWDFWGGLP